MRLPRALFPPLHSLAPPHAFDLDRPCRCTGSAGRCPGRQPVAGGRRGIWHYAKIGKYDLATDAANKLLNGNPDQVKLLETFEQIAEEQKDKIDVWMLAGRASTR